MDCPAQAWIPGLHNKQSTECSWRSVHRVDTRQSMNCPRHLDDRIHSLDRTEADRVVWGPLSNVMICSALLLIMSFLPAFFSLQSWLRQTFQTVPDVPLLPFSTRLKVCRLSPRFVGILFPDFVCLHKDIALTAGCALCAIHGSASLRANPGIDCLHNAWIHALRRAIGGLAGSTLRA